MWINIGGGIFTMMMVIIGIALVVTYWWAFLLAGLALYGILLLIDRILAPGRRVRYEARQAARAAESQETFEAMRAAAPALRAELGPEFEPYIRALRLAANDRKDSATQLEQRLHIEHRTADRLADLLSYRGLVGPRNGSQPRALLVKPELLQAMARGLEAS